MRVCRRADRDEIDVVAREEFVEARGERKLREQGVDSAACGDEVSRGRCATSRVEARAHRARGVRRIGAEMRAAHEAEADDADPDDADADLPKAASRHACGVKTTPLSM